MSVEEDPDAAQATGDVAGLPKVPAQLLFVHQVRAVWLWLPLSYPKLPGRCTLWIAHTLNLISFFSHHRFVDARANGTSKRSTGTLRSLDSWHQLRSRASTCFDPSAYSTTGNTSITGYGNLLLSQWITKQERAAAGGWVGSRAQCLERTIQAAFRGTWSRSKMPRCPTQFHPEKSMTPSRGRNAALAPIPCRASLCLDTRPANRNSLSDIMTAPDPLQF